MSPIFSGASGGSRASCGSPCKGHLGYEHQWYELPAGSTSQQFAATRKEFRLQPTALRNQGSHPKSGSPGSLLTRSQQEVDGNMVHFEGQVTCVRRGNMLPPAPTRYGPNRNVTFVDGVFAWAPTRRAPTLQAHVVVHNLPLDVDSNLIHVEFLEVLEARIELLRLEVGHGPFECRPCVHTSFFQGPGAHLAPRIDNVSAPELPR